MSSKILLCMLAVTLSSASSYAEDCTITARVLIESYNPFLMDQDDAFDAPAQTYRTADWKACYRKALEAAKVHPATQPVRVLEVHLTNPSDTRRYNALAFREEIQKGNLKLAQVSRPGTIVVKWSFDDGYFAFDTSGRVSRYTKGAPLTGDQAIHADGSLIENK